MKAPGTEKRTTFLLANSIVGGRYCQQLQTDGGRELIAGYSKTKLTRHSFIEMREIGDESLNSCLSIVVEDGGKWARPTFASIIVNRDTACSDIPLLFRVRDIAENNSLREAIAEFG